MSFAVTKFFDLSASFLADLFHSQESVWMVLEQIKVYLEKSELGQHHSAIPEGVVMPHPERVYIGKNCIIQPGAYLEGPCYIGDGCEVRHGAYVRANVILAPGCIVGHSSEVKGSIFLEGAKAPHFNYVGDSILGSKVNLGAGVKCANVRLDRKEITVKEGENRLSTGRRKLGAIIGDGCQLGCNSVTNPGTFMAPGACCPPCSVLHGVVLADKALYS